MSGIIKTIKAKDDNNIQHNIFPKTVLEAVVDSETNETLDNILADKVSKTDVVDNLLSTATDLPLSANQGRVINEKISANYITSNDVAISNVISNKNLQFWILEYEEYILVSITAKLNGTINADAWTTLVGGLPRVARLTPLNFFNSIDQSKDATVIYMDDYIALVTSKDKKYVQAGDFIYISGVVVK